MSLLEIILLSYLLFVQIAEVFMYYLSDTKSKILQIVLYTLYSMCFLLLVPIVIIVDLFKKIAERKHLKNQTQEEVKNEA